MASTLVVKATARHTATVIFLHGLGDSGQGWMFLIENFRRRQLFPEIKFILPTAPVMPVTCNAGFRMNAWYDIVSIDGTAESLRENEDEEGILKTQKLLHEMIQEEITAGIPSNRIMLGGFSQGGSMSIFSALTAPVKVAGVVGLSCYLLLSEKFKGLLPEENLNQSTPIFMGHGTRDMVVKMKLGQMSRDMLKEMDFSVDWKQYRAMGHNACPEEIDDVKEFIEKQLPPLDEEGS